MDRVMDRCEWITKKGQCKRRAADGERFCGQHLKANEQPIGEPASAGPPTSLDDPGIPIVLTVKMDADGDAHTRYLMHPEQAVAHLRGIADQIEAETSA